MLIPLHVEKNWGFKPCGLATNLLPGFAFSVTAIYVYMYTHMHTHMLGVCKYICYYTQMQLLTLTTIILEGK